jgi:succinate dehydrogenase flavin-adding protein (antitoxin of CptAB toxin-antitoxin module)
MAGQEHRMSHDQDIFARLREDHDKHRALLACLGDEEVTGDVRRQLFEELTLEVKGHAAAEEQALYSTMMRKPAATDEVRHSVAEHHEIEVMLNDLAATDFESDEWMEKFARLDHDYRHHIAEEEDEHFKDFEQLLDDRDREYMRSVFDRRKRAEKALAEVTPEKLEDAKE